MKNYKFVSLLKTFTKDEISKFDKFLDSPYFGIKPYTKPFYKELKKYYPSFDDTFSIEKIWTRVYVDEVYNDTTVRKIMSLLAGYAEEFFKTEYSLAESTRRKIETAQIYISKDLYNYAGKLLDEAESELLSSSTHDFELLTYLEGIRIYYNVQAVSQKQAAPHVFTSARFSLLDFINKYSDSLYYAYMNRQRYNIDFSDNDMVRVMKMLDTSKLKDSASGNIYSVYYRIFYALRKIIIENDKEYLNTFYNDYLHFEKTHSKKDSLHKTLSRKILRLLGNLAAFEPGFEKLWFEIRKTESEKNLLHTYISSFILRDYLVGILPAFYIDEINWAEKFADKYLQKMQPLQALDAKEFTDANILYLEGKYDEALKCTMKISAKDYQMGLLIKILQLKIYYDKSDLEPAFGILDAYYHYVRENKYISGEIENRHTPFADNFKKLLKAAGSGNKRIIEMSLHELNKINFFDKQWIVNRYNLLLKK